MKRQSGVAAITAILIVAVAASAATVMLSQQSAMLDQSMLVTARAQADLYAQAGVDWARGVLAEDARSSTIDTLKEGWAQPIAGLPVERALVAGDLADEQGKFNLNNLVENTQRSDVDMRAFGRLLSELAAGPPDLAEAVLDWIDGDADLSGNGGAEDAYYLSLARPYRAANAPLIQVEELYRVRGFDAATVAKLRPYVTALPARTPLNANTASAVVLAAVLDIAPDKARELVALRDAKPFVSRDEFVARAGKIGISQVATNVGVASSFFSVRVRVAQDDVQLATEALVQRGAGKPDATAIIWRRPRY
jgi:general secretion pathway protein K